MRGPTCPACGYDLRAQATDAGSRCPECGAVSSAEEIAPRGLWQGQLKPYLLRWQPLLLTAIILPAVVANCMFWPIAMHYWIDPWPTWIEVAFLGFAVVAAASHVTIGCVCGRRMLRALPWWIGACIGLAMTALAVVAFYAIAFTISFVVG